jgi:hypothetical protein
LTFNSHEMKALTHSYAGTVHKSQGQGKREVYHLANLGMLDNHSALVAFTRLTKGTYRMYSTSEDVQRLNERLGLERLKETVLDAGLVDQKKEEALHSMQVQSSQKPQHQSVQRPPMQRNGIQGKLDILLKEHREQRQALAQMSEGERKARGLLEVFDALRRAPRAQAEPAVPVQTLLQRQGITR